MANKDYQNIQTRQAAVRIEADLYDRVTKHFHQGQLTALFKNIFESMDVLMKEDRLIEITNYIYKAEAITLKPVKD